VVINYHSMFTGSGYLFQYGTLSWKKV